MDTLMIALAVVVAAAMMLGAIGNYVSTRPVTWQLEDLLSGSVSPFPFKVKPGDSVVVNIFRRYAEEAEYTLLCHKAKLPTGPVLLDVVSVIDGGIKCQNSAELIELMIGPNRDELHYEDDPPNAEFSRAYFEYLRTRPDVFIRESS